MKLTDRKWLPFYIGDIFDKLEPGKAKGRNHLIHDALGVSYIGATNRNNGVLDLVWAIIGIIILIFLSII